MLRNCKTLAGQRLGPSLAFQPAVQRLAVASPIASPALPCSSSGHHSSPAAAIRPCRSSRRPMTVQASSGVVPRGTPEVVDRVLSVTVYLLPFLNSFVYARFLYHAQPIVRSFLRPFIPLITPFHSTPFVNVIVFFGIYLALATNRRMSRFVRFNALQAILLDILLVLPKLVEAIITPPMLGWGKDLYVNLNSITWVIMTLWVVYGVFNALIGQYGRIPFIAEAADEQLR